jgi:hypothetical protein
MGDPVTTAGQVFSSILTAGAVLTLIGFILKGMNGAIDKKADMGALMALSNKVDSVEHDAGLLPGPEICKLRHEQIDARLRGGEKKFETILSEQRKTIECLIRLDSKVANVENLIGTLTEIMKRNGNHGG